MFERFTERARRIVVPARPGYRGLEVEEAPASLEAKLFSYASAQTFLGFCKNIYEHGGLAGIVNVKRWIASDEGGVSTGGRIRAPKDRENANSDITSSPYSLFCRGFSNPAIRQRFLLVLGVDTIHKGLLGEQAEEIMKGRYTR